MINLNEFGTIKLIVDRGDGKDNKHLKKLDELTEKEIYPLMILTPAEAQAINFDYLKSNNGSFTPLTLENNGSKFYTIKFKDIPSLIEFMSVDPAKYTIVENALSSSHENVRK